MRFRYWWRIHTTEVGLPLQTLAPPLQGGSRGQAVNDFGHGSTRVGVSVGYGPGWRYPRFYGRVSLDTSTTLRRLCDRHPRTLSRLWRGHHGPIGARHAGVVACGCTSRKSSVIGSWHFETNILG